MKHKFFLFILSLCIFSNVIACDVCGCFMGITPYDNQSSISFMHRYRVFNGYRNYQHHSSYFPTGAYKMTHGGSNLDSLATRNYSSADYESHKVFELRGKYFIHKRIELNLFTSVVNNKSKEDSIKLSCTGFSDPTFFIGYHIIQPQAERIVKQRLILGLGVKLRLGSCHKMVDEHDRMPFLMQPGTGSTDYFGYLNYVISYKKMGLSTTANYKINGINLYQERVGNSFTNFTSIFLKFNTKKWSFIPSVTLYHEQTKGLMLFDQIQNGTEMNEWMCGVGLDMYYKNFGLNIGMQKTVHQQQDEANLKSVGRIYASLTYNFNQRKYLLEKR